MFTYRRLIKLSCCAVLAGVVLGACQAQIPTPERVQEKIIETVVVTEVVEKEGQKVIETVIVTVEPAEEVEEPQDSGPRTLVICQGQEPDTLYILRAGMLAASHILQAIYDGPIDERSFDYQAIILEKLPSLADGDALLQIVSVTAGDKVVDASGEVAELAEGVLVKPSGCAHMDCAVEYEGGEVQMEQLVATFKLLPGLTWSDSTPLTAYDSEYSFELNKDPDTGGLLYTVNRTASYEALDELTVQWTGLPGFMAVSYTHLRAHETT